MRIDKKHRDFVNEPIGWKSVIDLPGIGRTLCERLETEGIYKACQVLGQFLLLKKDENRFKNWLRETCGADVRERDDCYQCLVVYCEEFVQ